MPKFFVTVVVFNLVLWAGVIILGTEIPPASPLNVFLFMLGLFIALGMTFTTLTFLFLNFRASLFMNKRAVFLKSAKIGFFVGFCSSGLLILHAFEVGTWLNYVLFLSLCLLVYKQFTRKRF